MRQAAKVEIVLEVGKIGTFAGSLFVSLVLVRSWLRQK